MRSRPKFLEEKKDLKKTLKNKLFKKKSILKFNQRFSFAPEYAHTQSSGLGAIFTPLLS